MPDPSVDPLLNELVSELVDRHGCHTVILYGSRARETHHPDSDYDLVLVRSPSSEDQESDVEGSKRDARPWRGFEIDAYIYNETSDLDPYHDTSLIRIHKGLLLRDEKSFGAQLLQRVQEAIQDLRPPISDDETASIQAHVRQALRRINSTQQDSNSATSNYRKMALLTQLLGWYFDLRGLWYWGETESLRKLAESHPPVYEAFTKALAPEAHYEAIERLAHMIVCTRSTHCPSPNCQLSHPKAR